MDKLVSIVLPVYNGERYLAESIESVLNQTYQNLELIIVNDCSTDATESIILSYAEKDARIIYLRNETNLRLPASLNRGFQYAHGEFWTWTSDDNMYLETAIEKMVQVLEQQPDVSLVYCDYDAIDENGKLLERVTAGQADELLYKNIVGACFLYRRQAAEAVGEYDTKRFLVEDYEFWLRIYLSFRISAHNECLYIYRRHSASLSQKRLREVEANLRELRLDYLREYEKKHLRKELLYPYFEYILKEYQYAPNPRKEKLAFAARHPSYLARLLRQKIERSK